MAYRQGTLKAARGGMTLKVSLIGCKSMLSHVNSGHLGRERLEERRVEAGRPLYKISQERNSRANMPEEGRQIAKIL